MAAPGTQSSSSRAAGGAGATGGGTTKAFIKPEKGDSVPCLFNPAELTIAKSTQWSPTKGKGKNTPQLRFQQGQSGTLTMALTLDTTDTGESVTKHTNALLGLLRVDPGLKGASKKNNSARPPWCVFHWGDFHSFKAVVETIQVKFTYFSQTGTPLRAHVNLTLKQYEDEQAYGPQNPTSGSPHPHSVHHLLPGETLDRVAAAAYGDPSRWRLIAETNGILDPLEIAPGKALILPDLEGVSRA